MRLGLLFGLFAALGCATGPKAEQTQGAVSPVATLAVQHAFVGEGTLEAKTDRGGRSRLALERLGVTARTAGDVAETSVEHVFRNDSEEVLEGTFRFPLPAGAILVGLAMEMNGELVDGELVEREKARKAYEQIVDQMLDPALLEWENGQTFKLRVFPIEPKKTKRVVLRFLAPLHRTPDGLFFAFRPPSVEAHIPLEKVAITVDGHAVRATSAELLVPVGPAPDVVVERTKDAAYFVAHVRPSFGRAAPQAAQKRQALIALCDRSRSMLEARALQTKTLGLLVDKLGADDRFTVVTGDVGTRALGKLRPRADKAAAVAFVDAAEPDGASDLGKLIMAAREPIQEARSAGLEPVVVVLGDGSATWGETRSAALAALAKDALGGTTMHVVLLGRSNDEPAARMLAAATDRQCRSAFTRISTFATLEPTKFQLPSTTATSGRMAKASIARRAARRCASAIPSSSHSACEAAPTAHASHQAATLSKIASRLFSVSTLESRTPFTRRSCGSTAAPTISGPAHAPLPTSSRPTITS